LGREKIKDNECVKDDCAEQRGDEFREAVDSVVRGIRSVH